MTGRAAPGDTAPPVRLTAGGHDSPGVPSWGVVSALAAPLLLVAGWTVAAALQPYPFNAMAGTVSALAALGSADRWVMTLAFALAGACEVATGLALRPAAVAGRLILMAGGMAGVLVAANPEHAGGSLAHACWAAAGFAALVTWPGGAWRRGPSVPWGLRPAVCAAAVGIMTGLLAWFLAELVVRGGQAGLAERIMGTVQAGWPLAVVLSCRQHWPGGKTPLPGRRGPRAGLGTREPGHVCRLELVAQRDGVRHLKARCRFVADRLQVLDQRAQGVAVRRDQYATVPVQVRNDHVVPVGQQACEHVVQRLASRAGIRGQCGVPGVVVWLAEGRAHPESATPEHELLFPGFGPDL
jgi:hypothetical protein